MSDAQRVIKYFAIGFAFLLISGILLGISFGFTAMMHLFNPSDAIMDEFEKTTINNEIDSINIDVYATKISIKESDVFEVLNNNKYMTIDEDHNKLVIKEKKHTFTSKDNKSEIIINIPKEYNFKLFNLDAGAGSVKIDTLSANNIDFNLGAGNVIVKSLKALESIDIDGGAGNLEFSNTNVSNLDLDLGVGNFKYQGIMSGKTSIEAGVGAVDLDLNGDKDTYKIMVDKGIGSAKINGENIKNSHTYGSGNNIIDIDGGIGSIKININ